MNTFVLEIWDDEGSKCTFYSVRWEESKQNETDKFFARFHALSEYRLATQQLLSFILDSIGDDHGAVDLLFNRFENEVVGLPNRGELRLGEIAFLFPNFPLRLYALRINFRSDLVVLFNGGIKTAQTNQISADLVIKWREACRFARRIDEALWNKEIVIDSRNRRLLTDSGSEDIAL